MSNNQFGFDWLIDTMKMWNFVIDSWARLTIGWVGVWVGYRLWLLRLVSSLKGRDTRCFFLDVFMSDIWKVWFLRKRSVLKWNTRGRQAETSSFQTTTKTVHERFKSLIDEGHLKSFIVLVLNLFNNINANNVSISYLTAGSILTFYLFLLWKVLRQKGQTFL